MKINVKGAIIPNEDKRIYEWFGMDSTCPNDVAKGLAEANGQIVDVEINSGGGSVFAGSEIYTALRDYQGQVHIKIVGFAGSAASVIAMAGYSEISPTAQIMVHNASSTAAGDYHDMDTAKGMLLSTNKAVAAAYIAKSGMSEQEALAMMDKETWLTAQQAVGLKLVDKVMFTELVASYDSGLLPRAVVERTRNMLNQQQENRLLQAKNELELLNLKGCIE